ncbi:MAG TPA: hypothetical protein VLQ20_01855 [Planococcus sp. (in: firmicutes)]|nr:hypothetical protein [Planococcus sp. (in: firmicutes)]
MFGLTDLLALVISAFIILPMVVFIRELGYLIISPIVGVHNPRLTIGSGPRIMKFWIFDIRKYYHLYSWYSYDSLKRTSRFAYVALYASPILINIGVALTINAMLANDMLQDYATFWSRFIFYVFYFVLFDIVPMKTDNGKPNNGMIIYEMLRYGRRTDYNDEPFLPSTSEVEEEYQQEMEKVEEIKEQEKEKVEEIKEQEKAEKKEKEEEIVELKEELEKEEKKEKKV